MAWPVYKFDAVTYTFYSVAVLTTALRVFVKARILRAFWLDDTLAVIATVCDDSLKLYHNQVANVLNVFIAARSSCLYSRSLQNILQRSMVESC